MAKKKQIERIWHDVDQNTDAWFSLRRGKITASAMTKLTKTAGKLGVTEQDYAMRLAIERLGFELPTDQLDNVAAVDQGKRREPVAVEAYELKTMEIVEPGGFYEYGFMGHSPDGRVMEVGKYLEIKCPEWKNHFKAITKGIDDQYYDQIQFGLMVCDLDSCDFVSFNPEYKGYELHIHTVEADKDRQEFIMEKVDLINDLAEENLKALKERKS